MKKKVMLKQKLLRVSIILIALFTAAIFFVTNSKVTNLVEKSISLKLDYISNLGMDIIESKYDGNWNVKNGKLYRGENLINNESQVLDGIKEKTGSIATVFLGDEKVATNELDSDGIRTIGAKVSNEVTERVLKKGVAYEGTENVLGETYAVKYVPIKDNAGKVLGIWFVGMPKTNIGSKDSQIFTMRISIVVISILCGILGCLLLMLYTKKFLNDIDTLKVSFLESNSKGNKTQRKVLMLSLFLIGTFFLIWFTVQGFTIGNVVNNLEDSNMKDRLNACSQLGEMLIDETYKGNWTVSYDKLYKGSNSLNNDSVIADKIGSDTEFISTIFMGDTRIATNISKADGTKPIGAKAAKEVVETVLKQGKEYVGEITVAEKRCIEKYMPLKDSTGQVIGMWAIGVEKKVSIRQIKDLRKAISQISILAILIAFGTFLVLSVKMVSDIRNYNVCLSTRVSEDSSY
ncbi:cache domain-containing protein [Acetivibrio mesophilus]|uniref:Histidine kinase n=1 Tax=Acetivibrio mesophilus TaxID=2487273 RepID=A0A4Q0I238_9FIRM|nr:cache domain-containing protein [Acetivibrio mesophilus]ODM27855.1 histidine kinase [Clostridium sp. Bc-iso-3]RXE57745.1 histidine kinase [Acetivibrio mesophilus]